MMTRLARGAVGLLAHRQLPLLAAGLAAVLTLPAWWQGWQTDDYIHQFILRGAPGVPEMRTGPLQLFAPLRGDPAQLTPLIERGALPWWTDPHLRIAFARPLAGISHWIDYVLWPGAAVPAHGQSVAWYLLAAWAAARLYRRVGGTGWVAGLAAVLYAVNDAHGVAVGWIANRNIVIAAALGLLSLLAHVRWRQERWRPGAALSALLLLAALLASESAVGIGAYVLAYALVLERGPLRRRLLPVLPCLLVGVAWAAAYNLTGHGVAQSLLYTDPLRDPNGFVGAFLTHAPLLLASQLALPPADLHTIAAQPVRVMLIAWAVLLLALLATWARPVWRARPLARFWALGMLLAVVPVAPPFPSDRLLLLVGVGGCGLLAELTAYALAAARRRDRLVGYGLLVVHAGLAPLTLPMRTTTQAPLTDAICQLAASAPDAAMQPARHTIIVDAPDAFVATFIPILRSLEGQSLPASLRLLAPNEAGLALPRVDAHTLDVRLPLGLLPPPGTRHAPVMGPLDVAYLDQLLNRLYRRDATPLPPGASIVLPEMTIRAAEHGPDGRARVIRYKFPHTLEDPALHWLRCHDGRLVPFEPPAIGQTVVLPPARLIRF